MSLQSPVLLCVFAHPDDEAFRCGGTLALLARCGVRVCLLTATRGEAGSCGDPPLCAPEALAAWREQELRCACAALGSELPRLLTYPDGGLADVNAAELTARILTAIREAGAQALISFGPDGLSGHPDHITIGRCAAEAFRQAEDVAALYTVAVPASVAQALEMRQVHAVPDAEIALAVDVSAVWEVKLAAIRCHATQLAASPMMRAPEDRQRRFFGTEHFVCAAAREGRDDFLPDVLKGYLL